MPLILVHSFPWFLEVILVVLYCFTIEFAHFATLKLTSSRVAIADFLLVTGVGLLCNNNFKIIILSYLKNIFLQNANTISFI